MQTAVAQNRLNSCLAAQPCASFNPYLDSHGLWQCLWANRVEGNLRVW